MANASMPFERSIKRKKSTQYRFEIDPQAYSTFMLCVRSGMGIDPSSAAAGLAPTTVKNWLAKGEILSEIENLEPHTQAWQYVRFSTDFKKARAVFELAHVHNINEHSVRNKAGQWTASAWMLERRRPQDYSQRYQLEQATDQKVLELVKYLFETSPDDEYREKLAAQIAMIPRLKLGEFEENP